MKEFFARLGNRFEGWMIGRYGSDSLTTFLVWTGLVLIVLDIFLGTGILSTLAFLVYVWALFRTFSRNHDARARENETYQRIVAKPKRTLSLWKKKWTNRNTTVYFKCKGCGQVLSVPKGKGTLRVVCPKCQTETKIKS